MGMSVKNLSVEQRKAIAVLAFHMMVADHEAVAVEHARVDWLEHELGVEGTIGPNEYFSEPPLSLFGDRQSQLLVMAELFLVAVADGRHHPNEKGFLIRLGNTFGLSSKSMTNLLNWATTPKADRPALDNCFEEEAEREKQCSPNP